MRQRHTKFEDTPYALEPNCKESPGGLRDLQVVIWVARAAGLGKNWNELAAKGLITPFEVKQLQRNEGLLKLIRAHGCTSSPAGARTASCSTCRPRWPSFGYQSTPGQRASEVLMRRYYWAAKAVAQLNQILMLNIEERVAGSPDAPMRPSASTSSSAAACSRWSATILYQRHPHAILQTFLPTSRRWASGPVGAHAARALQRPRVMGAGSAATR